MPLTAQQQARKTWVKSIVDGIAPNSFVWEIVDRNYAAFDKMLVHVFISAMTSAKANDSKVYWGFVKYLVQDSHYLDATVAYHQERLKKAPQAAKAELQERVTKTQKYARDMLALAKQLGGEDAATSSSVTTYASFEVQTAKDRDFYSSFVALIPCYLGYYLLGVQMNAAPTIDKNSEWYKNFVVPNTQSTGWSKQIRFFQDNRAQVTADQATLDDIFKKACAHECKIFDLGL